VGGLIAQGIGTSMLQIANVVKNPFILLPPVIAGALLSPLSTMVFMMENTAEGAGMGTSGFVGQIFTFTSMGFSWEVMTYIVILHFAGPAVLAYFTSEFLRRKSLINQGDMLLRSESR